MYSYFEKGCRNVQATISKDNMGYDHFPHTLFLTLKLSNLLLLLSFSTRKHTSMASCAIVANSVLNNIELKTIQYNTFRDCRVHFFRRPFS